MRIETTWGSEWLETLNECSHLFSNVSFDLHDAYGLEWKGVDEDGRRTTERVLIGQNITIIVEEDGRFGPEAFKLKLRGENVEANIKSGIAMHIYKKVGHRLPSYHGT